MPKKPTKARDKGIIVTETALLKARLESIVMSSLPVEITYLVTH